MTSPRRPGSAREPFIGIFRPARQLLEAVYRAEVERLAEAAEELGRTLPPVEALRAWLLLFIDHLATKKIIAAALESLVGASKVFDENKLRVHARGHGNL